MKSVSLACIAVLHLVAAAPVIRVDVASTAAALDFDELNYAAKLSAAAYAGCQGQVEDVKITAQIDDPNTGAQGFIGFSVLRKRIVISIRGSDQAKDYLNDLDIRPVAVNDLTGCSKIPSSAHVMNGVYKPWKAIHDTILNNLTELVSQHPDYGFEVTGHSLGGSMTYLGFVALQQNFPNKDFVANALNAFPIANHEFAALASSLISNAQPLGTFIQAPNTGNNTVLSSLSSWFKNHLPSSLHGIISALSKAKVSAQATPNRVLRRGTEKDDGVSNMWSISSTSWTPGVTFYNHFGTEFYYSGPDNITTTPVSQSGGADVHPSRGSGMSPSALGATYTLLCQGEKDPRCSAGDGKMGPTTKHDSSFGVRMDTQTVRECVASGGQPGASGGS